MVEDCPVPTSEATSGICFKCSSAEHTSRSCPSSTSKGINVIPKMNSPIIILLLDPIHILDKVGGGGGMKLIHVYDGETQFIFRTDYQSAFMIQSVAKLYVKKLRRTLDLVSLL